MSCLYVVMPGYKRLGKSKPHEKRECLVFQNDIESVDDARDETEQGKQDIDPEMLREPDL